MYSMNSSSSSPPPSSDKMFFSFFDACSSSCACVWQISFSFLFSRKKYTTTTNVYKSWMSYCYALDHPSSQRYYRHLMPESPVQRPLSASHSPTTSHLRLVPKANAQVFSLARVGCVDWMVFGGWPKENFFSSFVELQMCLEMEEN